MKARFSYLMNRFTIGSSNRGTLKPFTISNKMTSKQRSTPCNPSYQLSHSNYPLWNLKQARKCRVRTQTCLRPEIASPILSKSMRVSERQTDSCPSVLETSRVTLALKRDSELSKRVSSTESKLWERRGYKHWRLSCRGLRRRESS